MEAQLMKDRKDSESGKITMQSLLAELQKKLEAEVENSKIARNELQKKLEAEIENSKVARNQKVEIQEMLAKALQA